MIRVVVADDFPVVREGVAKALDAHAEIEVVGQAANGLDALELAEKLKPDVMILDLRMPVLGGLEVLNRLRALKSPVRVIVMSAREKADSLLDAVTAGAVGYLSKRSTGQELRDAVINAHAGGSTITPSLASHLLNEFANSNGSRRAAASLLDRELDVLRLVVMGRTDNEIAKLLFISPRTVQNRLRRVREKTGLRRRSELTRWCVEQSID